MYHVPLDIIKYWYLLIKRNWTFYKTNSKGSPSSCVMQYILYTVTLSFLPPTMLYPPLKITRGLRSKKKGIRGKTATLNHQALTKPLALVTVTIPASFILALSAMNLPSVGMDLPVLDFCFMKLSYVDDILFIYSNLLNILLRCGTRPYEWGT